MVSQHLSCDLSEPIREHGLSRTRLHRFESPIGLSHTAAESPILGAIWLISRLNALPRPLESVGGRSDSLTDHMTFYWEAVLGLPRPHRSASQIWESDLWGRGRPRDVMWSVWESEVRGRVGGRSDSHAHRASRTSTGQSNAFSRGSDSIARCAWESDRPPTRPLTSDSQTDHTASQIGLTDRTLWQIWLSDRSDRLDWS